MARKAGLDGAIAVTIAHLLAATGARAEGGALTDERSVRLYVDDAEAAGEAIERVAKRHGALRVERSLARATIVVPRDHAGAVERDLDEVGTREGGDARSNDVAELRIAIVARIASSRKSAERLATIIERRGPTGDLIAAHRALEAAEADLRAEESDLDALDRDSRSTKIEIELRTSAPDPLPTVRLPFPWLDTVHAEHLQNPPYEPESGGAWSSLDSNVDLGLLVAYSHIGPSNDASRALALGLAFRGADTDPIGIALGFDALVGGFDGFFHEARALVGAGTAFDEILTLGALGGIGASGWDAAGVDSSAEFPVEVLMLVDADDLARLALYARPAWTTAKKRQDGARSIDFADQLTLGGALLLPHLAGEERVDRGGVRLGFEYAEIAGERRLIASAGIGVGLPEDRD